MSANPTVAKCKLSVSTSNLVKVTLPSTAGLSIGYLVEKFLDLVFLLLEQVANVDDATTITLSAEPTALGPAVLNFIPAFGDPANDHKYTINAIGVVDTVTLDNVGNGYSPGDEFTLNSGDLTQPIEYPVTSKDVQKITFVQTIAAGTITTSDTIEALAGDITNITFTGGDTSQTTTGPLAANVVTGQFTVTLSSTTGISVGDQVSEDSVVMLQLVLLLHLLIVLHS